MSTTFGQKLRLNVAAIIDDSTVGRLLVCIDDEALVEDLKSKIRCALARSGIDGHLLRLTNRMGACIPPDEKAGDVLRDAEEVVAVLTGEPEDPLERQQLAGGMGDLMSFARAGPSQGGGMAGPPPVAPRINRAGGGGPEESFQTALPPSPRGKGFGGPQHQLPGPSEAFEEDMLEPLAMKGAPPGSDWSVEGLAPKLREYISTRFREAHASTCAPGNSFIAVTMQPRARAGAVRSQSIYYSIARIDVVEFERLCASKIQEYRSRADHFQRCKQALQALLEKGTPGTEYAANMLPYRYRSGGEVTDLLSETDMPTFGQVEGFRPTIVIDNSGAVGESLVFIRTALKRILYSFLVAKSKFNLVKFSAQGKPIAWANGMVPPTAQVLREAEEFLDGITPVRRSHSANLLEGIQLAMAHPEADTVYVLSSGLPRRYSLDVALRSLRSMNIRDLPLHILGVECEPKAELELRRIADDNHGSFRQKRFGPGFDPSSSSGLSDVASAAASGQADTRLTISGQLSILDIMLEEQEIATVDWLEEQKCANRLLLTTQSQQPVPDAEQARAMYQRSALGDVKRQMRESESRLQELVDAQVSRAPGCPAVAAGYLGAGTERRRVASRSSQRGSSQPPAGANHIRRPSVVNPWDRPGSTIKASELKEASKKLRGNGALPPRIGRPLSARARPSSAGRRGL